MLFARARRALPQPEEEEAGVKFLHIYAHICQQCGSNPAALRCRDCLPRPFFCDKCDVMMHSRYVLHNRKIMTAGFFQPLPPTTYVLNKTLCHDA
ncbi:hypothetical protein ATANTOWER_023107 [Ataeniobius toweri]|uniref:C2H2-type domain-containing protein n=1 Tax=Ataeniobius toweri TaxID=208326 RepID=A0ABU7BH79_9TELE|nr:hypothetical protein [Ataeniobius toweri]